MKRNSEIYMDSIYNIIDEPVNTPGDNYDVEYVDGDDNYDYDDEPSWEDDITFIGDDEDNSYVDPLDYGEGYIPLPQGEVNEYDVVVIDENYVLDEYESDINESVVNSTGGCESGYDQMKEMVCSTDEKIDNNEFDLESTDSVIKLPNETVTEELNNDLNPVDDKISKAIARERMEEAEANVELLPGDELSLNENNDWVDNEDLYGNNIDVIKGDDPNQEVEDTDYVDGSFEDWIQNNDVSL